MLTSCWIFKLVRFFYGLRGTGYLERNWIPRGRATAPCPPYTTAALGVPSERTGTAIQLVEGGRWGRGKVPSRERFARGSAGEEEFPIFSEAFPSYLFSVSTFVSFPFEWNAFLSENGTRSSLPPDCFLHPRFFELSGRALDSEGRIPWFAPHVLSSSYCSFCFTSFRMTYFFVLFVLHVCTVRLEPIRGVGTLSAKTRSRCAS